MPICISQVDGVYLHDTRDALIVATAVHQGVIAPVPRRLSRAEKREVGSGRVYCFFEVPHVFERWTDGRRWSASRILKNGLIYLERPSSQTHGPAPPPGMGRALSCLAGAWRRSADFNYDSLLRKTFTVHLNAPHKFHVVSYYTPRDVSQGSVVPLHCHPLFHGLEPDPQSLQVAMLKKYQFPPRISWDEEGIPHYLRETGARCTMHHATAIPPSVVPAIAPSVVPAIAPSVLPAITSSSSDLLTAAPYSEPFGIASSGGEWSSAPDGGLSAYFDMSRVPFVSSGIFVNDLWLPFAGSYVMPPVEAAESSTPYADDPVINPSGYAPMDAYGVYYTYPLPDYHLATDFTYPNQYTGANLLMEGEEPPYANPVINPSGYAPMDAYGVDYTYSLPDDHLATNFPYPDQYMGANLLMEGEE